MTQQICINERNAAAPGRGIATSGSASSASSSSSASSATSPVSSGESSTASSGGNWLSSVNGGVDSFNNVLNQTSDAIDGITDSINDVDCGDELWKLIQKTGPYQSIANKIKSGLDKIDKFMKEVSTSQGAQDFTKFVDGICKSIEWFYSTIDGWLDLAIKALFVLFRKIDAAMERLENALLDLTEAVVHCVLSVIDNIRRKISKVLFTTLDFDWDALVRFMNSCPCLTELIAYLFNCQTDDDGKDIRHNAYSVVECIRSKIDFFNPAELMATINAFIDNYITKYIKLAFGYIESWLVYIFQFVMKPVRWLMKQIVQLLTNKLDVTSFINGVGVYECFFVYSTEYNDGKKFLGMSIIDMLNTYRQWINCFEYACPGLSSRIRNNVKQRYKDLRLDDKYWRSAQTCDLYSVCLAAKVDSGTARETTLRDLYPESPYDLLMAFLKWWKHKDDDDDEGADPSNPDEANADPVDDTPMTDMDADPNTPDPEAESAISQSIKFISAQDTENEINCGNQPLDSSVAESLDKIAANLANGGSDYYTEKFYQLLRFLQVYKLDVKFIKSLQKDMNIINKMDASFGDTGTANVIKTVGRKEIEYDETYFTPTYFVESEYDRDRSRRMMSCKFDEQEKNENLVDFYARMYQRNDYYGAV